MVKRYVGKHLVEYLGTYDGEGTLWGEWRIGPFRDRWMITLKRPSRTSEIHAAEAELIV
ncbi:MAG TPA: hypothetical protein VES92_11195 [Nitrospiraceae bacterium]|nr:hypothetical protein [Nitrospiraceae bacterium]